MLTVKLSETTQLAMQLMSKASLTPHDADCQQLAIDFLTPLGFRCESHRFGEVDNLWARWGNAAPLFVFAGHTDIVPTGPESEWTTPPFSPTVREGYLYGRGACDMKAAIAAALIASRKFLKTYPRLAGSIAFLLTSDEEGPAINGTVKLVNLLRQRGETIDYCVVGEPSSDIEVGDQIRIGRRGSLHGKLTVYGKQGHVAHPQHAINPIHQCLAALHEIAHQVWDQGNEHYPPTTLQISNIHGGTGATNVIPGHIEILFNFRFGTASQVSELQERTENILRKFNVNYQIIWDVSAEPFLTRQGSLIQAAERAIKEVTGRAPRLSTGGGTSDGRFIAPTGAQVIELGPSNATAHHIDERVKLADLDQLTDMYYRLLTFIFI